MKKMLIAGNWKMNTNSYEAGKLAESILNGILGLKLTTQVLICPPFINIPAVSEIVKETKIMIGAQNCFSQPSGAYTGEISIPMLQFFNCSYVIIGHSERRQYFFESNESVNQKLHALLNFNMNAIMCIGETLMERSTRKTFDILETQLRDGLKNIDKSYIEKIVIAYEPVWAIGTGVSAEVEQVQEAHSFIRKLLIDIFGDDAQQIIIQYGGSVTDKNALSILELPDVNGALIGGASLKPESFLSIIKTAQEIIGG